MTTFVLLLTLPLLAEGSQMPNGFSPALHQPFAVHKPQLVSEVRSILSTKCAACHGAQLARPKGKFGHVEDLNRLAGDANLVVRFRSGESKLWQLIQDNEMPPKRAKTGTLSAEQKNTIRAWIESGAKTADDVPASVSGISAMETHPDPATEQGDLPFFEHLLGWLGKFHVPMVHFPIALLIVAAAGELWSWCRGIRQPTPAVRFCILLAAAGAVAATLLGWLHAAFSGYAASSSQALVFHRWTGTTAGVVAIAAAVLSERDTRRGVRSSFFRVVLFLGALLVSIAAHLGGTLVYGANYFNW
jgi:uncharacterized membrane protein